jgi:hypothetical protein
MAAVPRAGFHLLLLSGLILLLAGPAAAADVRLPNQTELKQVDFERHVMGLFSRMGCNNGSCHGSFQGRGSFRLSLFGYDPAKDFGALTRDALGRRIDRINPDRSEMLLKATAQIPHEGGQRFARNSWQYDVFRAWIAGGAPWRPGSGEVAALSIHPPEYAFTGPGQQGQLQVQARFADGTTEDITPFCDFRINDDVIAEVSPLGEVKSRQPGDTAVIVSYRGRVVPVRVLVPRAAPAGFTYPELATTNYIDREVFAKLRRLNIVPSDLAGDAEFLRRVTIDTIGSLPSPEEVRAFLADKDPGKRARKIDELLAHPLHAALWATKFCDITGNNTDALENPPEMKPKRSQMWYDWFRKRVAENMPYDQIVRGVLCATSREGRTPDAWLEEVRQIDTAAADNGPRHGFATPYAERATLDLFWRRQQNVTVDQWGEKTAAAFLGVRLECAQCHKHPFDRWTQADYRSYANIFSQIVSGVSPEAKKLVDAENADRKAKAARANQVNNVREVYLGPPGRARTLPDPDNPQKPLPPKTLGGPVIEEKPNQDPRAVLFDWMRSPDNPFFARSFANRVWGHYFGVGIVDPVDDFSLANPPSNEKLLDALAQDFLAQGYDIRALERTILNSRVYQLSSRENETNRLDRNNYSHSFIRPMMAEVVVDVLNAALDSSENFGADGPPDCRAIEVGASRMRKNDLAYIFRIFGRPPRSSACDCERALAPALPQKLFLMTDPALLAKLQKGRLQKLLATQTSDEEVLNELFLATLTRLPSEEDRRLFAAYRANRPDRKAAFVDTLWALINTREFILNH